MAFFQAQQLRLIESQNLTTKFSSVKNSNSIFLRFSKAAGKINPQLSDNW
jgi:hypothetical protein